MKRIFAIGGGEITHFETLSIDKKIVKATGKSQPRALFIPTASGEPQGYIDSFNKLYGDELGCVTDVLLLLNDELSTEAIKEKILSADIVYVGGGNTKMMMEVWRKKQVDEFLLEAYNKGIVLSGMSAGSICWFTEGQSDTETYEAGNLDNFITVKGIGILHGIHSPHYHNDNRDIDFDTRVQAFDGVGIGIDDNCCILFEEDEYKIIKGQPDAHAYKVYYNNGCVHRELLENETEFLLVKDLLNKSDT